MFFCGKKIGYLSLYRQGEKVESAGFVKICRSADKIQISLQIKLKEKLSGEYPLLIQTSDTTVPLMVITLLNGQGSVEKSVNSLENGIIVHSEAVLFEDMVAMTIKVSEDTFIEVKWEQESKRESEREISREIVKKESVLKVAEMESSFFREYPDNKWGQLLQQFRNVHPFGDDRLFIAIELKDFVILRENYQKLVHNSFLLHSFHNYRHFILGMDCKIGNAYETCFYLGVPGIFYEREKMVAVMFGFEGFECEGPVEIGKYGYYLRQVQI